MPSATADTRSASVRNVSSGTDGATPSRSIAASTARHQYVDFLHGIVAVRAIELAREFCELRPERRDRRDGIRGIAPGAAASARARRLISVIVFVDPRCGIARRGRVGEDACRVGQSSETLRVCLRVLFELENPLGERDKRRGEVAAVDGRDITRMQWRQGDGVVPIQEMPLVSLEALERQQRGVHPLDEILGRQIPEIVRGERRQQAHADVGRRRAASDFRRVAVLLVVVRRKPGIGFRDEGLEIAPGAAGRSAQDDSFTVAERADARADRHAEPIRDRRCDRPENEKGCGGGKCGRLARHDCAPRRQPR